MNKKIGDNIVELDFTEALSERYLAYALSTITSRSLPDVRDGLKPVHRRILFAMHELKLDFKAAYKKSARVVGDVIGKYHPHGEMAIYDTLVRLAQDFSIRYPLIDGQGNFGSIDGDNAAAMRYTESKLTQISEYLLKDLEKSTVNFKDNYDGHDIEPVVLPAMFPNILANGSEGIAVGMATSIPTHNIDELAEAMYILLKNPDASVDDLLTVLKGPDFPTGGILYESQANIRNVYTTGRGSLRVRAKWHKEDLGRGAYQVVITELPYQVKKSKLIEKMVELFRAKKLVLLDNISDESTHEVRIILEPKNRAIDAEILMESLFKLTDLEVRIGVNLNVLNSKNIPSVMNLKEILTCFIEFRKEIISKRTKFELEKIADRLEILGGLIIAYLNLDEIIRIIRYEDEPKDALIKTFNLTDRQAEAILNMRLRNLRKLEETEIKKEQESLLAEQKRLLSILESDKNLVKVIVDETKEIQKLFGKNATNGARRTEIIEASTENVVINIESFIEKEPLTIFVSQKGWIRAVKSHNYDLSSVKYKEGDEQRFVLEGYTTDKILFFASNGKFYTIQADNIPRGKGDGDPLKLLLELGNDDEIVEVMKFVPNKRYLLASDLGKGFVINSEELIAHTKSGKQILNCGSSKASMIREVKGDHIAIIGTNRKLLIFKNEELAELKKGQGVTLQKYKQAAISDIKFFNLEEGLVWQSGARQKSEINLLGWVGKRAQVGKLPPIGFSRDNKFNLY